MSGNMFKTMHTFLNKLPFVNKPLLACSNPCKIVCLPACFQILVLKNTIMLSKKKEERKLPFRWPKESSTASRSKSFYCCPFIFNTLLQCTFISTLAKCTHWFPMVSLEEGSASLMMSTKGGWPHSHSNANPALLHFCLDHMNIWPAKNSLPCSYRIRC